MRGTDGRPAADAVVLVRPAAGVAAGAPIRFSWSMTMNQRNISFDPYVLIVPLGSNVAFPNRDTVRHHVYSFSPVKRFELKLYGHDETRSVTFDKPGVVALGCNIHDEMIGFIYVTDTPYTAKTGANGEAVLRGVPPGRAVLSVWHPDMKAAKNQIDQPLSVGGDQRLTVPVDLRAVSVKETAAMHHH